ncbi:class I SAM-dependent methyltransferase [Candidatus Woesearchaeota archaeon]|nr:class I SAM-dependent methyltransferase [Candidatus Woesearchaeota archaeon]
MDNYYNSISHAYNELHREEQLNKIKIISNELRVKKTDKLLDVGCGTGFCFDFFKCKCYGVEPSKELLSQCKNKEVKLIKGKAEELPFEDDFFDIVISVTAIHNFDDIEKSFKEMKRVGKGRFAFSVLKKAKNYDLISNQIKNNFTVKKIIKEKKDIIYFC